MQFNVVNKAYADRIKYKIATGNIPNTVMTDHTLFTFPAAKAFASGKIKICEMWVERLADEWIATSSPMFAIEWHCNLLKLQRIQNTIALVVMEVPRRMHAHDLLRKLQ